MQLCTFPDSGRMISWCWWSKSAHFRSCTPCPAYNYTQSLRWSHVSCWTTRWFCPSAWICWSLPWFVLWSNVTGKCRPHAWGRTTLGFVTMPCPQVPPQPTLSTHPWRFQYPAGFCVTVRSTLSYYFFANFTRYPFRTFFYTVVWVFVAV